MPIQYYIDHERRLVVANVSGIFTAEEAFSFQQELSAQDSVLDFDQVFDMTAVQQIADPLTSTATIKALASEAAAIDARGRASKVAIVAPQDLAFGLGRMYQTFHGFDPRSVRQIKVVRTLPEALEFLGLTSLTNKPE